MMQDQYMNDLKILDLEKMSWQRMNVAGTPPVP